MKKHLKKISYVCMIISMLLFSVSIYMNYQIDKQINEERFFVLENTYIGEYDISRTNLSELKDTILEIEDDILSQKITILVNDNEYDFSLKEVGIIINKKELEKMIMDYENDTDYFSRYNNISSGEYEKKSFDYRYDVDQLVMYNFLLELSKKTDIKAKKGKLSMNSNKELTYINEVVGFSLDIKKSFEILKNNFSNTNFSKQIELIGTDVYENDKLKLINKKISSFSTSYDTSLRRKYNLETAAGYINGTILYPGDTFSFFSKAAPFNKPGYVYYDGVLANGVCQVATTLYNAQLLAGLKTVTRYNHGKLPPYVKGGLDATVAQVKTYITDYKFQNNFKYPVYISAYTKNGKVIVDIWSNENATNGIVYKTESVKIGYLSFSAYRYGYKDGKQVSKEYLGNSYYYQ